MRAMHVFVLLCVLACCSIGIVTGQEEPQCNSTGYNLYFPYTYSHPLNTLKANATNRLRIGLIGSFPFYNLRALNAIVYQLNNNNSILPDVAIDLYSSTTASSSDILESTLFQINSLKVHGIIAGLTATEARNAQLAAKIYSIPHVSFMATSYILANKDEYPYFLRTMPSDELMMQTIIALFKRFKWKQGIIIYSTDDFGNGFQKLTTDAAQQNITLFAVSTPVQVTNDTVRTTVDNIVNIMTQRRVRIFIYYSQFICSNHIRMEMRARGYYGAEYVDILSVPVAGPQIQIKNETWNDGAIGMTIDSPTNEVWRGYQSNWYNNPDIVALYPKSPIAPNLITDWLGVDALLAFAYAADAMLKAGHPFTNGSDFLHTLLRVNFTGTTGQVFFNSSTGDRLGDLALYSVYHDGSVPVGYYSSSQRELVETRTFLWAGRSTTVPSDGSDLLPIVVGSDAIRIIFGILVGICTLIAIITLGFLIARPLAFQKSGRFYCGVIIFGAILAYAAAFTTLPEPTDALCLAFPWLLGLGFMLLFGCLFLKTWALFQVFRAAEQMKKTTLNPMFIMKILGVFVVIEVIFMIVWSVVDPPKVELITVAGDKEKQNTCGPGNIAFWAVFIGYKGFWMLFGAIISFLVRNVRDDYNESAGIAMSVYNCFGMTAIALVLGFVLKDTPNDVVIIENVAIIVAFTVTLILLFSRTVINVIRGKDRYITNQPTNSHRSGTGGSGSRGTSASKDSGSGSASKDSGTSSISYTQSKKSTREVELA